jgi:hypothetical protein
MPRSAALPFLLKRGSETFSGTGMTTTKETVHGLLRLEGDTLTMQWRVGRKTEYVGALEMSQDQEVEAVREIVVPLRAVAGAVVRYRWWHRIIGPQLILAAADLSAFEEVAGKGGLSLDHPAELVLRLRRSDRLAGEEFSAELALAIAELGLTKGETFPPLEPGESPERSTPTPLKPPRLSDGG